MDLDELRHKTRRGLATATAHLTATEGPLRAALDELTRRGIGARVIKGALAAAIAWALAGQVTPGSLPFVASLTALFSVQLTIAQSVTGGRQRLLGVLVGIVVAVAVSELVGLHAWSMGVVVLAALVVGLRLRLESGGVEQVAATAIVVMFVQSTTDQRLDYAASHLIDTVIGTAVGLTLNALVVPPNYVPAARRAVQALGARLVFVLEDIAAVLSGGATSAEAADLLAAARMVERELADVEEALERAEEGLEYNIVGSRQRDGFSRCRALNDDLRELIARTVGVVGAIARRSSSAEAEGDLSLGALAAPAAEVVSAVTVAAMDQVDRLTSDPDGPADPRPKADVASARAALDRALVGAVASLPAADVLRIVPIATAVLGLAAPLPTDTDQAGGVAAGTVEEMTRR